MLKLTGFGVIIILLCLAAGTNADWSVQESSFSSNVGTRSYLQMTPSMFGDPFSNPGDTGLWLTDTSKSKLMSAISAGLQIKGLADCAAGTCLIKKAFPVYLTFSDAFRLSHNDSFETEIHSTQQHMAILKGATKYSHQTIVIMEEDPAVMESAIYLFERHSTLSTLLRYTKEALHLLRGSHLFSAGVHDVILVGHGSSPTNGTVQLSGYGPEELAKVVSTLKTEFIVGHLGTISLMSCNLGNDLHFVSRLLRVLQSFSIKTKLHLYNSLLSVNSEGAILTSTDGVWRSHDYGRRVIAELDKRGNLLTTVELGCTGPTFPNYKGNVLYLQTLDWPNHPQMFVPTELRKKYPSIDCLEGLTWSLFFEENERRRAHDYVPDHNRNLKPVWLTEQGPAEETMVFKQIVTIQDLLVEIRYNAREEVVWDLYYVLNECIYKVHGKNLTVTLVGKFMSTDNQGEIEHFLQNFSGQQGESSLQELRQGLKPSKFNDFCRQTFQFQQCSFNCERWGHYFMVAVFTASVRNFRTFSLFLMSVIGCEVGRLRGTDSPLCTAFVGDNHPMVSEQPWPQHFRRGFYGCTVDNYELATQDRQIWLDEVVAKENSLYMKSRQLMSGLYHDEQTELEIFGRVKVMNKYVFSSYLEFFRGTPEGKKLKRGCIPALHERVNHNAK